MTLYKTNLIITFNIALVFLFKSIAPGLSILDIFNDAQIYYFFQTTAIIQLYVFVISLGHTSDKEFSFFNVRQIIHLIVRSIFLSLILIFFDIANISEIIFPFLFALMIVFSSIIDFRMKFYSLFISRLYFVFFVLLLSFILSLLTLSTIYSRVFIQVVPFFLFSLFLFLLNLKNKNIWLDHNNNKSSINFNLLFYAFLTSIYVFIDRRYVADYGDSYNRYIFILINISSFMIFFMDYFFKRKNTPISYFKIALAIYNIFILLAMLLIWKYAVVFSYLSISLFQFFGFSLYAIYKNKITLIIITSFFIFVCSVIVLSPYMKIEFENTYLIIFIIQIIFSLLLIFAFGRKNKLIC